MVSSWTAHPTEEPRPAIEMKYRKLYSEFFWLVRFRFTDVVAKWPGSQHDASTFESCGLKSYLENHEIGWLLGDSGYPLRKYLITPKPNPMTDAENRFNVAHSQTRIVVERAFGVLKSRFR